jgi:hypothetical protein
VINWGESTFIQGGINAINPVDVSALRVPGLRAARRAAAGRRRPRSASSPPSNTSLEAFYQYDWVETKIDPVGSYFSTTDLAGAGATKVMLGFGAAPTRSRWASIPGNPSASRSRAAPRARPTTAASTAPRSASSCPALGGTEFGLYHLNYHSRLPLIMARTGTATGLLVNGNYAASASYFLAYPEDIKLYGVSFNAQLGRTGIALQGEVSHRRTCRCRSTTSSCSTPRSRPSACCRRFPQLAPLIGLGNLLAATNQVGAFGFDEEIAGFRRFDTTRSR